MDCCNYMQHRQSYYGSHYYESAPSYPEYHQQYNNNMQHYGGQNWAFASSACSDYVYNPKEARLRKAMRERERSMGAAQMGTQRARRSPHWPKPPHHMPPSHGEHLLGPPTSDIRAGLRHELQHGFLNEASSGGYVYQPQQYQFSPQNDYATYIQVPSSWMPNGYIQGNAMAQQHIWNQYQSDRLRHQQTAGPGYMMNHQDQQPNPSYHHPQHHQHQQMQSNQILQMQAPQKTSLHQNIETPPSTVDRFLNMSNTGPRSADMSHSKKDEQSSSILMANSPSSSSTLTASDTLTSSDTSISESNISGISDMVNQIPEPISASSTTAELVNVTNPAEANLNLGAPVENSENGFGGMQLFEEENLPAINAQDLHKSLNATCMPATSHGERKNSNSLPDFNQAFGSTERGRFQSPPDPRIGPEKEYLEFYNWNFSIKSEQYSKWVEAANSYTAVNYNNI